ncbi:hypothetical protein FGRMN_9895 [Fusarium graminum]|nr:hypothetical protein FGRMN_9895 [Fusarium graminum]
MAKSRKKGEKPWHAIVYGRLIGYVQSWKAAKNLVDRFPGKDHMGFWTETEATGWLLRRGQQRPLRLISVQRALEVDPTLKKPETYEDRYPSIISSYDSATKESSTFMHTSLGYQKSFPSVDISEVSPNKQASPKDKASHVAIASPIEDTWIVDDEFLAKELRDADSVDSVPTPSGDGKFSPTVNFKDPAAQESGSGSALLSQSVPSLDSVSIFGNSAIPLSSATRRRRSEVDDEEEYKYPQKKARLDMSPLKTAQLVDSFPSPETHKYSQGNMDKCMEQIVESMKISNVIDLRILGMSRVARDQVRGRKIPSPHYKKSVTLLDVDEIRARVEAVFEFYKSVTVTTTRDVKIC